MDAMYWEHPIDLDKIRRLVGWRQMAGGRGGRHRHGPGGPGGPGGFRGGGPGGGFGGPWMGPLFGGMHGGPGFGRRRRGGRGGVRPRAPLLPPEGARNGYPDIEE